MATYTTGDNKLELMESGGTLRDELEKNNRNMEKIDNKLSGGVLNLKYNFLEVLSRDGKTIRFKLDPSKTRQSVLILFTPNQGLGSLSAFRYNGSESELEFLSAQQGGLLSADFDATEKIVTLNLNLNWGNALLMSDRPIMEA